MAGLADGTAQQPAGRCAARAGGAEVAVQQSQLLVSAEPGHGLRDGAHSHHGAGRVHGRSRRAFPKRDRRRRRRPRRRRLDAHVPRVSYSFNTPQPVRYLGIVISRMTRVDAATVALDIVPTRRAARHARRLHAAAAAQSLNAAIAVPPVGARNTVRSPSTPIAGRNRAAARRSGPPRRSCGSTRG